MLTSDNVLQIVKSNLPITYQEELSNILHNLKGDDDIQTVSGMLENFLTDSSVACNLPNTVVQDYNWTIACIITHAKQFD